MHDQYNLRMKEEALSSIESSGPPPDIILDPIVDPLVPFSVMDTGNWGYRFLGINDIEGTAKGKLKRKVVWCVLDTAGKFDHPALSVTALNEYGFDATGEGLKDENGHGHHCAGIIAGVHPLSPNEFPLGVSPAKYSFTFVIPLKGLNKFGQGWDKDIASCIDYAIGLYNNEFKSDGWAFGISGSFGGRSLMNDTDKALKRAEAAGIFLNFAAGNAGCSCSDSESCNTVNFPARNYGNAIAAIQDNGSPASFSSCGPDVDFAAPGFQIYSTYKDKRYVVASGTSMACPMDAGINSWLLAMYPEIKTPAELNDYKRKYVKDIFNQGFDERTGHGVAMLPIYVDHPPTGDGPPLEPPTQEGERVEWWVWGIVGVVVIAILFFMLKGIL